MLRSFQRPKLGLMLGLFGLVLFLKVDSAQAVLNDPGLEAWVPNGPVYASVTQGEFIYLAGKFNQMGPATGGSAMIGRDTGETRGFIFPKINDTVYTVIPDNAGGWYLGGEFTKADGVARNRLVHVLTDGSVDPNFNPDADGYVRALALSPDGATLYAGGDFQNIGGAARSRLAALNVSDGTAASWNPGANGLVRKILVSADGVTVFAGGEFTTAGGAARNRLAALNADGSASSTWNPNANNIVWNMTLTGDGTKMYVAGDFTNVGGAGRNRIAALDTATGSATSWNPNANDTVRALALSPDEATLYAGGDFTSLGGSTRNRLASVSTATGQETSWNPNADKSVYTLTLEPGGLIVYAGGDFTKIGGVKRSRLAAIDPVTGDALAWNPGANDTVRALLYSDFIIYAGGDFTSVGLPQEANGLAMLYRTDGSPFPFVAPDVFNGAASGTINTLAVSPDGANIYIGGDFDKVGNTARSNIAALKMYNPGAEPPPEDPTSWNPNSNGIVRALVISSDGGTVYAGGDFTNLGGAARNRLAAVASSTAQATAWNPGANGAVYVLKPNGDGSTIFVGGKFTSLSGEERKRLGEVRRDNGQTTSRVLNHNNDVLALAESPSGDTLYIGGNFTDVGGNARNRLAAIRLSDNAVLSWNPNANNDVRALVATPDGSAVYVGGDFTSVGGAARNRLAAIKTSDGNATSWNPNAGGVVRSLTLTAEGATLYVGGDFKTMGGELRNKFVQFDSPKINFTNRWSYIGQSGEAVTPLNVEVALSEANTVDTVIDFALRSAGFGAATPGGVDMTLPVSPLIIPAGATTSSIAITVVDDSLYEPDEQIILELSGPKNTSLRQDDLFYTTTNQWYIMDNDPPPSVQFALTSSSGSEASTTPVIQVNLSAVSGKDTEVQIALAGTATNGVDYNFSGGPYIIPAGQTTLTLPLTVIDDLLVEPNETIQFTLTSAGNAALGANTVHTYTIIDND